MRYFPVRATCVYLLLFFSSSGSALHSNLETTLSESSDDLHWDFTEADKLHEILINSMNLKLLFNKSHLYPSSKIAKNDDSSYQHKDHYLYLGGNNPKIGSLVFLISDKIKDCKLKRNPTQARVDDLVASHGDESKKDETKEETDSSCRKSIEVNISGPIKSSQAVYEDHGNIVKLKGGFEFEVELSELSNGGTSFSSSFKIIRADFVRDLLNVAHKSMGLSKDSLFGLTGVDVLAFANHYFEKVKERIFK